MRVLVVNEPELTLAIERLRGEWSARSGGPLSASSKTWDEVANAESLDADLIIFPTRYLGELCVENQLRPMRPNVLEGELLDASDILPLARRELVTFGGQTIAIPMGISLPSEGLLVEAAPDAVDSDRLGVLFDPNTMEPRITEPSFVDALTRIADGNPRGGKVPVLGTVDRLIGVTATSRNAATAFQLLEWLASREISTQLAKAASGTSPVRRSLLSSYDWSEGLDTNEKRERALQIERAFDGDRYLLIPRIPGIDEYLAALDDAVADAKTGEVAPQAALQRAAVMWDAITDRLGRDSQREAYAKHLGVFEP